MAKANEKQISGTHYKTPIECWDYIVANDIGYLEGNAIKYITRWRKKNGIEDLRKAQHYLEKLIELEEHGGVARSVERPSNMAAVHYAENAGVSMGGLYNSDNVAGQDWHGLATYPEFLQDNSAINAYHMSGSSPYKQG